MRIRWHDINWLWAATVVTTAYIVVLTMFAEPTAIGFAEWLRSAEPNDFGDFLAGVFAPLAVIWLVAAVLTQRQELNTTRKQLDQNKEVVGEQLSLIRAQNTALTEQNVKASEAAKKAHRLNLFDKRFEVYSEFIQIGVDYKEKAYDMEAADRVHRLSDTAQFMFGNEVVSWMLRIGNNIRYYVEYRDAADFDYESDGHGDTIVSKNERNANMMQELKDMGNSLWQEFEADRANRYFIRYMRLEE